LRLAISGDLRNSRSASLTPAIESLSCAAVYSRAATKAATAQVAIVNFIQYTVWEWGRIAAAGTLVMLPVVIFSIPVRNYLSCGLAAGRVKE
jgi:ABC-type glycerol-3-phosphate transport system permease component